MFKQIYCKDFFPDSEFRNGEHFEQLNLQLHDLLEFAECDDAENDVDGNRISKLFNSSINVPHYDIFKDKNALVVVRNELIHLRVSGLGARSSNRNSYVNTNNLRMAAMHAKKNPSCGMG